MGTRSTITFYSRMGGTNFFLVNIYQQYDGYLEGVGKELCEWLKPKIITNGFSKANWNIANGAGCLAAKYISEFKPATGGLYIYPEDVAHEDCDYNYSVIVDENWISSPFENNKNAEDIITIEVDNWGEKPFFKGSIQELLDYIERQKEEE